MLEREEYVEQAHFFRSLGERHEQSLATQDLLMAIRQELLSTTNLPLAIDFLSAELRHSGVFASAMARLPHYFTAFQTFVVEQAEREGGKFDFRIATAILEREARFRAQGASPQAMFVFQFETLCRNRLGYDRGLEAMSLDPIYDEPWREWILSVRRRIGLVELADLIYLRSAYYIERRNREEGEEGIESERDEPPLFGVKEGRIALANRRRDPLLLFAALERHLGYPSTPRPQPADESRDQLPALLRRVERLETRLKLIEEEQKGGIDITRFYGQKMIDLGDDLEGDAP